MADKNIPSTSNNVTTATSAVAPRSPRRTSRSGSVPVVKLGAILVCIMLFANLFMVMQGAPDNQFTFERLLQIAEQVGETDFIRFFNSLHVDPITSDWGVFNFFRDFLNANVTALNVVLFVLSGIATISTFVVVLLTYFIY